MTEYVSLIVSTRETHLLNVTHSGLQCLSAFEKSVQCALCSFCLKGSGFYALNFNHEYNDHPIDQFPMQS